MNGVTKMLLNLIIIGALSGAVLSGVFTAADPMIKANKEQELREAVFYVLPEARDFVKVEKTVGQEKLVVYKGINENGEPVGMAFKADGNGFQANIGLMVGLDLDYLKLKGIEVLDQLETPGLGDRIRDESFKDQFKGLEVKPRIEYIKFRKPEKPNQIQAITGATISSEAVIKNINRAVEKVVANFPREEMMKVVDGHRPAQAVEGQDAAR
ncbi:MAG: RnfABCDGE type electron transport complex subunit G [Deltaproteobacteria bacterium]|nr:RnfABCDGE type electron transport complex subunit G [Deltaproteobacteria bacterium]MCL4872785.1 RnfABCDGE type electron transport complex subunit G [bacterium]